MAAAAGSQTVRGQSSANTALPKAAMKTNKPSPTKNDGIGKEAQLSTPKVVDLMITGQWRVSGKDGEDAEPDDEDSGQAEVAIFAKVIPVPGAVLEIIRLDKSMLLKRNSYKATPLLPDGSTPRVSVGSRYLGIPAIEGRYPQDADGRVKVTRRASNQGIKGDQSIDGIYDTKPNTRGSSTAEHIPSKMSDGTDPGHDSNSTSHDGAGDEVKNWLDNYNAGTQLTQNRHGVLCISFDENIRRDAVLVEIYILMQPLLHTKSTVFKFAGLPYCSNGIKVMLDIIDAVAESEWVYDTTPQLDHRDNARNTLSGTFYTTPGKGETTLIVCAKQIVVIQEPVGYSAEITTEASSLLYRQEGIIVLFYTVNIILNGAQPLSPFGSPKLTFKVYNVMAGDDLEVGYCPGASVTNSLKDNSLILEITRPLGDAFEEFSLDIMAQRARSTWSRIMIPKIVPVGGNLISDTILFEDLGDQPLSYRWPNNEGWKYLHREKEKRWTHEFTQSTPMIDGGPHLEIAFAGDPLGPIGPCQQLTPEQDNIITNVSYAVYTPRELKGDGVYELQLTVTYSLNELGYNRRVFSIFTDQWDFLVLLFNDTEASGELFIPCNSESNTRAIMNVVPAVCSWYSEGKDIVMDSYWRKLGKVVELTKDGEIITSVKNKHSKKTRGKRLLDITEYVCLELPYITDRKVDLLKFEFHGRSNLNDKTPVNSLSMMDPPIALRPRSGGDDPASPVPGSLQRSSHWVRGTLEGEIYRDATIYVTRQDVAIYFYLPLSESSGNQAKEEDALNVSIRRESFDEKSSTTSESNLAKVAGSEEPEGSEKGYVKVTSNGRGRGKRDVLHAEKKTHPSSDGMESSLFSSNSPKTPATSDQGSMSGIDSPQMSPTTRATKPNSYENLEVLETLISSDEAEIEDVERNSVTTIETETKKTKKRRNSSKERRRAYNEKQYKELLKDTKERNASATSTEKQNKELLTDTKERKASASSATSTEKNEMLLKEGLSERTKIGWSNSFIQFLMMRILLTVLFLGAIATIRYHLQREREMVDVKAENQLLRREVAQVRREGIEIRQEVAQVREEIAQVRGEVAQLRHDQSISRSFVESIHGMEIGDVGWNRINVGDEGILIIRIGGPDDEVGDTVRRLVGAAFGQEWTVDSVEKEGQGNDDTLADAHETLSPPSPNQPPTDQQPETQRLIDQHPKGQDSGPETKGELKGEPKGKQSWKEFWRLYKTVWWGAF